MEAGGKDCEEETLQTAFKKLRVDAGSLPGGVSAAEAAAPRGCQDASGAKPKVGPPKENWHGSMRKTSRGASRTQRRRRSKSPILHPPNFTYCSAAAPSTPSGGLKHQRLTAPEPPEPRPPAADGRAALPAPAAAQKELPSSGGRVPPLVFGSRAAVQETAAASTARDGGCRGGGVRPAEDGARGGAESAAPAQTPGDAADFRALSESPRPPCCCAPEEEEGGGRGAGAPCRCRLLPLGWRGVEVYSFTGLRSAMAEGQRSASHRTVATNSSAGSSCPSSSCCSSSSSCSCCSCCSSSSPPRSCSEQARSCVDDITIEDLSGYMEFFLYIPKKMSHMAEMMYT
ncbi:oxidative stress-responsive serine-rich protein 1 [Pseudoliparis swirei]|uniref:oxidative stress-responsive serine-rich protein 1 n=1 Tax=Pseudoliparis swirei TaxID=2059687 RepID=UPI0024BE1567|nr:oxidative stress-responsive serine-rich protein 1 [Pseudoliparis swirei]